MRRTFRAGDIEKLNSTSPVIFNGMLLERAVAAPWRISLSQSRYDKELRDVAISDFFEHGMINGPSELRTPTRKNFPPSPSYISRDQI